MSPDELAQYEAMVDDYRYADSIFKPVVAKLVGEVRTLSAMTDWLADIADYHCGQDSKYCMRRCPLKSKDFRTGDVWCSTETTPELWREAARKAVSND